MDMVSAPDQTTTWAEKHELYAGDLLAAFAEYAPKIKFLSLDCFDTLLWRKTARPMDVFYDLQHANTFKAQQLSASLRVAAESKARKQRFIKENLTEVTLHDIYCAHQPTLSTETLAALANEELALEIATCYAFPPVVELIRAAAATGIKVILVSDTYFIEKELRQLLSAHLPADVMAAISRIFCSSEHGKSKSRGLFKKILAKMHIVPKSILHIGDHKESDYNAAKREQMHALRLLQNDPAIEQLLRLQTLSVNYLDANIRHQRSMASPFHGMLANANLTAPTPETLLGYVVLGPLLYVFAKYILAQANHLQQTAKKPKILFLLRDGYLPSLVTDAVAKETVGYQVRISRFVALAASFRTQDDVINYLGDVAQSLRFADIGRQLLLPEETTNKIIASLGQTGIARATEFIRQIQSPQILQIIFDNSAQYRSRLKKHLVKTATLKNDDQLLIVDLGYSGTAQNLLAPLLQDEMSVAMKGCYLLVLPTPNWEANRSGLLDPSWCDERSLHTLISYIALLEQVCTSNDKSVVDFDETGDPIFSQSGIKQKQHHQISRLQTECLRFAQDAEKFIATTGLDFTTQELRDTALAHLSRLIFMPTQSELDYLESIEFDLNLGTDDILKVFDQEAGLQGLKRRGLFFMEKNAKTMRTNYPAELRSAGFELSLFLMAQHRFGMEIRRTELSLRREVLPVIAIRGEEFSQTEIIALPTYDGYFSLSLPLGNGGFQIAVQFGLHYEWLQIESIDLIKAKAMYSQGESQHTQELWQEIVFDNMAEKMGHIFECLSPSGLLMYANQPQGDGHQYVLRIVFRPLVKRQNGGIHHAQDS